MYYLTVTVEVVPCGNEHVVHVDEEFSGVLLSERSKHLGHGAAKGGGGVAESKVHDFGLVRPEWSLEGSFPTVFFCDSNVFVSPPYVKFSEDNFPLQVGEDSTDQG